MKIVRTVMILVLVLLSVAALAELKGKDFVEKGELQEFSGNLIKTDEEWSLQTEEATFDLHFGPQEYLQSKEVVLQEDTEINLTGYLYKKNIAVVKFVYYDVNVVLRSDKGDPLWHGTKYAKKHDKHYVDSSKCIGCKLCVSACPTGAISMKDGKAVIDPDKCINCGICINGNGQGFSGCPVKAINKNE
ncbi:MAG: hypothetical protein PWQ09_715 [Candidatus Cloacimonadota bacterium]|jgi:ferredoxin|nr:hypothetical protein [Candidatus Cloacimonadota bacterium]